MHSLTIYGTPEDRIMIEGEFHEEVDAYEMEEGAFLALSDGTLMTVAVDEGGVWRIAPVSIGMETALEKLEGTLDAETESDRVTVTNPKVPFRWALLGAILAGPPVWPERASD
jgi:hypothetical protein